MVDLMAQYEQHGLQLDSRELPDHLPLYLEYLAQLPEEKRLAVCRTSRRSWRCSARVCSSVKAAMRCCSTAAEAGEQRAR
jgi:nitrate reductase molybdenum cofactor assembly chaperone